MFLNKTHPKPVTAVEAETLQEKDKDYLSVRIVAWRIMQTRMVR